MSHSDLYENPVFHYFREITKIPRCSFEEEKISNWLKDWATARNLQVVQDDRLNILIKKPGQNGLEESAPVILQGHMDMVCEKLPNCDHDFSKDPIYYEVDGDEIVARETTLGADNGIAVAMILAVLDDKEIAHPPIEAFITTDEENGMTGAQSTDPSLFQGKRLINLDSEEEGVACVGCAGGEKDYVFFQKEYGEKRFSHLFSLNVSALKGGHSGAEIDKGLGNANILLGRALLRLQKEFEFDLYELEGGAKSNAIPRDASAIIGVDPEDIDGIRRLVVLLGGEFTREFAMTDPRVKLSFEEVVGEGVPLTEDLKKRLITFLTLVPNGINSYSHVIPGLVESSVNLGVIKNEEKEIVFEAALRSSVESLITVISNKYEELADLLKGRFEARGKYPAWEFRQDSPLRDQAAKVYSEVTGKELALETIHAGLECALFDEIFDELDMLSIGPDIKGAHAPGETLSISSTERVYEFLKKLLGSI